MPFRTVARPPIGQVAYAPTSQPAHRGGPEFEGVLDRLSVRPDFAWSSARRLTRRWNGPIVTGYRTTDGEQRDFYPRGRLGLVDPSEVREFNGWNLVAGSEDLSSATYWTTNPTAGTGSTPTRTLVSSGGPNGRSATRLQFALNGGTTTSDISAVVNATASSQVPVSGFRYAVTVWAKSNDGSSYSVLFRLSNQTSVQTITSTWTKLTFDWAAGADGTRFYVGLRGAQSPACSNTADILVSEPQVERGAAPTTYEPRTTTGAGDTLRIKFWDQMGGGRHFQQSNSLHMPYLCQQGVPATKNGLLVSRLVAAESRREAIASSTAMFTFLHTTGGWISTLSQCNDTGSAKILLANKNNADRAGIFWYRGANETPLCITGRLAASTDGRSINVSGGTPSTSLSHMIANLDPDNLVAASRVPLWRENGSGVAFSPNVNSGTPGTDNSEGDMTLGLTPSGASGWDGDIAEVMIGSGALSSDDVAILEADKVEHWGAA